jgi:hypothetical protein
MNPLKSWPFHNLVSHPLSELSYWILRPFGVSLARRICGAIHDWSIPEHHPSDGRG